MPAAHALPPNNKKPTTAERAREKKWSLICKTDPMFFVAFAYVHLLQLPMTTREAGAQKQNREDATRIVAHTEAAFLNLCIIKKKKAQTCQSVLMSRKLREEQYRRYRQRSRLFIYSSNSPVSVSILRNCAETKVIYNFRQLQTFDNAGIYFLTSHLISDCHSILALHNGRYFFKAKPIFQRRLLIKRGWW